MPKGPSAAGIPAISSTISKTTRKKRAAGATNKVNGSDSNRTETGGTVVEFKRESQVQEDVI